MSAHPLVARIARSLNRVGLSRVNYAAKRIVSRVGRDSVAVKAEGLRIVGTLDSWTILQQIGRGTFERFEVELFKEVVKPGMTVLDVGANIGFYTLLAARLVGPTGCVFAFEPDPRTRTSLERNLSLNGIANVTVIPKGAAARRDRRTFYQYRAANHSSLYHEQGGEPAREIEVETVSVDEVLDGRVVDVVKMDIEGEEPGALEGMTQTLRGSPSMRLFVEFAPIRLRRAGHDPDAFLEQLREWFPSIQVIDGKTSALREASPSALHDRQNLVCHR